MADEKNSGWYVEFRRGWWARCLGPNRDTKESGEITSTYHGSVTEAEMLELDRIVHDFLGRRPHPDGDAQVELLRGGKELKITVGGSVHQRSIREWHALSVASFARSSGPILDHGAYKVELERINDFQPGMEVLEKAAERLDDMWRLHARAFDAFLNELYAIMVDPCATGTIKREDMMKALKDAAMRDRQKAASGRSIFDIEREGGPDA